MCGELGYTPDVFYELLYCELLLILEGYRERQRKEYEERKWGRAWHATIVATCAGAKDITPAKLLGVKEKRSRRVDKDAEARALKILGVTAEDLTAEEAAAVMLKGRP